MSRMQPSVIDRFVERAWVRVLERLGGRTRTGSPSGLLRVWPLWERTARTIWPTIDVPNSPHGVLAIHFTRHHGPTIVLNDGVEVRKGDPVAELHFNNPPLISALGNGKWAVLTLLRHELHSLSLWMTQPSFPIDVRAVFGTTMLWRGAARLGFTIPPRPVTAQQRLDRLFLVGLMALYSSEGVARLDMGKTRSDYPQQCWLSREELLRRYLESND